MLKSFCFYFHLPLSYALEKIMKMFRLENNFRLLRLLLQWKSLPRSTTINSVKFLLALELALIETKSGAKNCAVVGVHRQFCFESSDRASSENKLQWSFFCCADIRVLLGRRAIRWKTIQENDFVVAGSGEFTES